MIAGVDEAGRGCIIGPMVICAAAIRHLDEYKLKELGVRDSKKLSVGRREALFPQVTKLCKYVAIKVLASEINTLMDNYNLNEIEAMKAAEAIDSLKAEVTTAYIDSPDNVPSKFATRMRKYLKTKTELVAENRADDKYLVVGAASIIAKVTRDREIEKIKKETGIDFNSGYTSDPKTQAVIKRRKEYPQLEPYLRTKWATLNPLKQRKLMEFE